MKPPFPVYVLEDGVVLPDSGTYYIVAQDGIWLRKETGLFSATIKVPGIGALGTVVPRVEVHLPKIPPEAMLQIIWFFRRVYRRLRTEAIVLLHYNLETGAYALVCPEQDVSVGSILRYDLTERVPDYRLVGSIHSHGSMTGFHSGVDRTDEATFDGLHITIGRLDQPFFHLSCTIAINDNRFPVRPEDVIQDIREAAWEEQPSYVATRRHRPPHRGVLAALLDPLNIMSLDLGLAEQPAAASSAPVKLAAYKAPKLTFYDIRPPDGFDYRLPRVPDGWMERVHEDQSWRKEVIRRFSRSVGEADPHTLVLNEADTKGEKLTWGSE